MIVQRCLIRQYRSSDTLCPSIESSLPTFNGWLEALPDDRPFVGLFMDYETFGEHQSVDTGIFDFMDAMVDLAVESDRLDFATPTEVARRESVVDAEVADVRDHGGAELVVGHAERTQIELQAVGREIDQRDHRLQQRRGCSQDRLLRSLGPVISGVDPLYRIRQLRRQLGDRFSVGRDDLDPGQVREVRNLRDFSS